MINYEYSDNSTVAVVGVRKALQAVNSSFNINSKACAVETFEEILKYFHKTYENCKNDCYSHNVFGYEFSEETSCECNESSEKSVSDYVIRAYIAELYQISQNSNKNELDILLGKSLASQSYSLPCSECKNFKFTKKKLISKPKIFAVSLTWAETSQKLLLWFTSLMSPVLILRNLFSLSSDETGYFSRYIFKGMVCFLGSHYVAFFYSMRRNAWMQFDDSSVSMIYDWQEVIGKVIKGRMIPVLIFYELDSILDSFKRQYQLEFLENDTVNYLLDPDIFFDSFTDVLTLDLAGLTWKSDIVDLSENKKCSVI